jgi:CAI-1 autoinducer synthase
MRFHQERDILHGRVPGPDDILLNSSDYLALGRDPRITDEMTASLAAAHNGVLACGVLDPQSQLESALAAHAGTQAGVLCQSGWDASIGLLQVIADERTPVYIDALAHMSPWYGAAAAKTPVVPVRHNDLDRLRRAIGRNGPGVIAVDALYGINGSLAPLPDLCDIADQTGCVLVVDESHSLGVYGQGGEGLTAGLGLAHRVHFQVASLANAFAGRAGFIACPTEDFARYFKMESPPAMCSPPLPAHDIAGLAAALTVIRADGWRRTRLHDLSTFLRNEIAALGLDLQGSASHIIAIPAGLDTRAIEIRDALESRGIFGSVCAPLTPATAPPPAVVKFSVHAGLTDTQAERIVQACREVRDHLGPVVPAQRRQSATGMQP